MNSQFKTCPQGGRENASRENKLPMVNFLLEWDQRFLRLARDNQLNIFMYKRYVDDSAEGMEALKPGVRWSEGEGNVLALPLPVASMSV